MKTNKILLVCLVLAMVTCTIFAFTACSSKYTIGVQSGTTGEYFVKGDADWDFEGFSNVKTKPYSNAGLAVQDLKSGNLNAVVIDEAPAKKLASSVDGIKVIDIALTEEEYAFGVDKTQDDLKTSINNILESSAFQTEYTSIINKYFGDGEIEGISAATTADSSKAAGQLVVATNAEFAPFEYKIGDKFAGIDMEIAKYIADTLNLELVILDMEFDSVVTSVGVNNVDIAMAGLTVNETRKESVNFTNTYYKASQMIIVLSGDTTFDACVTADDVVAKIKTL